MICRLSLGILLFWASLPYVEAQQGGSTGNTGTTSRKEVPRPQVPTPQPGNQVPVQPPSPMVFISGDVVREDGSVPPFGAAIELNCGGSVTREAMVTLNGRFSFQVGADNRAGQVFPDASQGIDQSPSQIDTGGRTPVLTALPPGTQLASRSKKLLGCELRAQLHGYRSTTLNVKEEPLQGLNEIGTIVIYPIERVQGTSVSLASMLAPKAASKQVDQGQKAVRKKDYSAAEVLFNSALEAYPNYGEAWCDLGDLYKQQARVEEASNAYKEAIKVDDVYIRPYVRLAQLASEQRNWREAADVSEQALKLDPVSLLDGYYINALAHLNLNELEIAEKRARQGKELDFSNQYPQFYLILANVFAFRQDSASSIREMKNYLKFAPNSPNAGLVRALIRKMEEAQQARGM